MGQDIKMCCVCCSRELEDKMPSSSQMSLHHMTHGATNILLTLNAAHLKSKQFLFPIYLRERGGDSLTNTNAAENEAFSSVLKKSINI